jgi:DNA-binding NtrC family response regulator
VDASTGSAAAPAVAAGVEPSDARPAPAGNGHADAAAPAAPQTVTPTSLAEVSRLAALQAERDLIIPTLRRVQWNRRKAAPLLGVSYKTLLNKIKEYGIVQE